MNCRIRNRNQGLLFSKRCFKLLSVRVVQWLVLGGRNAARCDLI